MVKNKIENILESEELKDYIATFLKDKGYPEGVQGGNFTGAGLSALIYNYIYNEKAIINDVDIFLKYLNLAEREKMYPLEWKQSFGYKEFTLDPDDDTGKTRYEDLTDEQKKNVFVRLETCSDPELDYVHETFGYSILASTYLDDFNYTFISFDDDFEVIDIVSSFDLTSVQVIYDIDEKELLYTPEFLDFLVSKEHKFTDYVYSGTLKNCGYISLDKIQSLIRGKQKMNNFPNSYFNFDKYASIFYLGCFNNYVPVYQEDYADKKYSFRLREEPNKFLDVLLMESGDENFGHLLMGSLNLSEKVENFLTEKPDFLLPYFTFSKKKEIDLPSLNSIIKLVGDSNDIFKKAKIFIDTTAEKIDWEREKQNKSFDYLKPSVQLFNDTLWYDSNSKDYMRGLFSSMYKYYFLSENLGYWVENYDFEDFISIVKNKLTPKTTLLFSKLFRGSSESMIQNRKKSNFLAGVRVDYITDMILNPEEYNKVVHYVCDHDEFINLEKITNILIERQSFSFSKMVAFLEDFLAEFVKIKSISAREEYFEKSFQLMKLLSYSYPSMSLKSHLWWENESFLNCSQEECYTHMKSGNYIFVDSLSKFLISLDKDHTEGKMDEFLFNCYSFEFSQ